MKRIRLLFVICLLGLSLIGSANSLSYSFESISARDIDVDITEIDLPEDPHLAEPQDVVNEGPISEFSSFYDPPSGGLNNSLMHLIWSHNNDTPLDFKSESELNSEYPDCNDFIYFEQSFSWNLNRVPEAARYAVTTSITTTGDFSLSSSFYEWYVWLIDSSGNFIELYESRPTYNTYLLQRSNEIYHNDIDLAWGGMVEDENGFQADPTDILTLAVGLAPTLEFVNNTTTHEGTVQLTISDISLTWYSDGLFNYREEPAYTYAGESNVYYGNSINDIEVDASGAVYAVGHVGGYSRYSMTLTKLDSKLNPIWKRTLSSMASVYATALDSGPDGTIYSIGYIRAQGANYQMHLTVWDSRGSLLINRTNSFLQGSVTPRDIFYSPDGFLYITGDWYNTSTHFPQGFLLKCDLGGNILWYQLEGVYGSGYDVVATTNGTVYVGSGNSAISAWSPDGFNLWNSTYLMGRTIAVDTSDDLYATSNFLGGEIVSKWDLNGTQEWNTTWGTNERYQRLPYSYAMDIAAIPSGISYVAGFTQSVMPWLVKRTDNGSISNAWTWDIEAWSYSSHPLEIGNGMVYLSGSMHVDSYYSVGAIIAFHDVDIETSVVDSTNASLLIVSISTVGICTIAILGFEKKWFEGLDSKLKAKLSPSSDSMKEEG